MSTDSKLSQLQRSLARERTAREEAERLLESKAAELYSTIEKLRDQAMLNVDLVAAIEMTSDGIALTDADGLFTFMNSAHEALFGYGSGELLKRHWTTLYAESEQQRFTEEIIPTLMKNGAWRGQSVGQSKTGKSVFQEVSLTTLDNGSLICATRDVSARLERQARARELETRLLETEQSAARQTIGQAIAHDFGNLISAISGYALLMQADLEDEPVNLARAEAIGQAAHQAAMIVESLSSLVEDAPASTTDVNIVALAQTTLEIVEAIRPVGIRIITTFPAHATVATDEVLLSRCLLNVIKNAFEAMPERGKLHLRIVETASPPLAPDAARVTLGPTAGDHDWILEISDNGHGITPNTMDRIFDPFFTTKATIGGTGMGMQSLQLLSMHHNIPIEIESAVGVGTRVRMALSKEPCRVASEPVATVTRHHHPTITARVLLVDDDTLVGTMLRDIMKAMNFAVTWFTNGFDALESLRNAPDSIDVLVTDYTMPGMKGDEVMRNAKAIRASLPCILISGERSVLAADKDADGVLAKPVSPTDLKIKINEVLAIDADSP